MLTTLLTHSGSKRHEVQLTDDELQKYPESLVSELASCANGNLDLDALPENPIKLLPAPAATITSLYRNGKFDIPTLNYLLSLCNDSPAATVTRLSGILTYLRLPGAVCDWLPNLTELELQHARIIQLVLRAYAQYAVQLMLDLKPFEAGDGDNPVLYVVQGVHEEADTPGRFTALNVYHLRPEIHPEFSLPDLNEEALLVGWRNLLRRIADLVVTDPMERKFNHHDDSVSHYSVCERLPLTTAGGANKGVVCTCLGDLWETTLVSLEQALSSHINEELQAACNRAGVLGGCISIAAYMRSWDDRTTAEYKLCDVPVWFIKWW